MFEALRNGPGTDPTMTFGDHEMIQLLGNMFLDLANPLLLQM